MSYNVKGDGINPVLSNGGGVLKYSDTFNMYDIDKAKKDRARSLSQLPSSGINTNQLTNTRRVSSTELLMNSSKSNRNIDTTKVATNCLNLSPVLNQTSQDASPHIPNEYSYSVRHVRSTSASSDSSNDSTNTVYESDIFPAYRGRYSRSTSPPSRNRTPVATSDIEVGNKSVTETDSSCKTISPSDVAEKTKGKGLDILGIWRETTFLSSSPQSGNLTPQASPEKVTQGVESAPEPPTRNVQAKDLSQAKLRKKRMATPDLVRDDELSRLDYPFPDSDKSDMTSNHTDIEEDVQSVSTVSGSGINFFRKFVQRKGTGCKECESQFRRDVLIDRLVSDSLNSKALLKDEGSNWSWDKESTQQSSIQPNSRAMSKLSNLSSTHSDLISSLDDQTMDLHSKDCLTRCKSHNKSINNEDTGSISTKSSVSISKVSGTGLLFLRNYLKKKTESQSRCTTGASNIDSRVDPKNINVFNSIPIPFPPPEDSYGPAFPDGASCSDDSEYDPDRRRLSMCSTVADLLNDDFDCEDSELKNLDWEEWDEPLPEELSYDDLLSVISESLYSDDHDLMDLYPDLDLEGRKTVVAAEQDIFEDSDLVNDNHNNVGTNTNNVKQPQKRRDSFLKDLQAELELPPMTPVTDEKEEAVRALSATLSKYMRQGSCGSDIQRSYDTTSRSHSRTFTPSDPHSRTMSASDPHSRTMSADPARTRSALNQSRAAALAEQSRHSVAASPATSRLSQCRSRMSRNSTAMSDYNMALSTPTSPLPSRRPLSQLLTCDVPIPSPERGLTMSPVVRKPSDKHSPLETRPCTSSPQVQNSGEGHPSVLRGAKNSPRSLGANNSPQQQPPKLLSRPKTTNINTKSPDSDIDFEDTEVAAHNSKTLSDEKCSSPCGSRMARNSNRDSLLFNNYTNTPPMSPSMPHSSTLSTRIPYLRHSSSNSTDSGCPLLEDNMLNSRDKMPSLSPTPSPGTNIENVMSSNRTKLASFWEKSLVSNVAETTNWVTYKDGFKSGVKISGFLPVKPTFRSEQSLAASNDRVAHFHDVTRRAVERRAQGGLGHRLQRASIGSDCSDFIEKIPTSPRVRRRDSLTEYFV